MKYRADTNNEPTKEVRSWNGIPLNITTKTGEARFSFSPPMSCDYGCIRGSWGAGLDGKALDVYVVSDAPTVFKVVQVKPDTKEIDEYKYILGAKNLENATNSFLSHVPQRFFGGITQYSVERLKDEIFNKKNNDSTNEDSVLIIATQIEELLEDDEAYGSDLQLLKYTIKNNNDIEGIFRDAWNDRVFSLTINSDRVGYKPRLDTDSARQFDSFSIGYVEKFDAAVRKTRKPKCTGISYNCGAICLLLKNTCWIKMSGVRVKRSKTSKGAVVSISQGRIDKIRSLANTMRMKGITSWRRESAKSLESKASKLEHQRANLLATGTKK